jgi:hypothetical protein
MAFKPNYGQQRRELAQSKESKKQEKLLRREEAAAQRKLERERALEEGMGEARDSEGESA